MNARKSTNRNVTTAFLAGMLFATVSFNAVAESTATLDTRSPVAATLLPSLKVSASISNPSAEVRWRIAPERALSVTLMPTLTVTADAYAVAVTTLPTVTVIAQVEAPLLETSAALALAPSIDTPVLGVSN